MNMRNLKSTFVQGAAVLAATLTFTLTGGAAPTTVVASAERLASGAGGAVAVSTINL